MLSALLCNATRETHCDLIPVAHPELLYALGEDLLFFNRPGTFLRDLVAQVVEFHPAVVALNFRFAEQLTYLVPTV